VTGPGPILDSFSPAVVAPGGEVLIYGANFTHVTSVKFSNVLARTFGAPAHTQLQVQVPTNAPTGRITVTTTAGTVTSAEDLVVTLAPVISAFWPEHGKAGLTRVTIEGLNFTQPIRGIAFNGHGAFDFSLVAPNQIAATVPREATTGPIAVTNASGRVGVSPRPFRVTEAPLITDFAPTLGAPGTSVVINGANFLGVTGPSGVQFNGTNAASYFVTADTQIHAVVPSRATTGPLVITNAAGRAVSLEEFTVIGNAPYPDAVTPDHGPRGSEVLITGRNFTEPVMVKFNGANASQAAAPAPTQIRATVPPEATSGPLTVSTASGTSSNHLLFYVPPRLTSFAPTSAVVGTTVVLTGTNFLGATEVRFGQATVVPAVEATNRLRAVVPSGARSGPLRVTTPGGAILSTNPFRVLPDLRSFSPWIGPVDTLVTLRGTSFFGVTNVSFNHRRAVFTNTSETEVLARVPAGATDGPIRVATPEGVAVSATHFVVTQPSDLVLSKTLSPRRVQPGALVDCTLFLSNRGPTAVTGVQVTDPLPAGMAYVSAVPSRGIATYTNGVVTCLFGTVTNGEVVSATILARLPAEGVFTNTALATAVEPDLHEADNRASDVATAVADASCVLQIQAAAPDEAVVISWPVSAVPFQLESTRALEPSNGWSHVTPAPVILGGRNVVTNVADETNRFYRLLAP
jgi:uncharacterized repeat protein (TIGR01451 family)